MVDQSEEIPGPSFQECTQLLGDEETGKAFMAWLLSPPWPAPDRSHPHDQTRFCRLIAVAIDQGVNLANIDFESFFETHTIWDRHGENDKTNYHAEWATAISYAYSAAMYIVRGCRMPWED